MNDMTQGSDDVIIDLRPRPVRNAARIVAAVASVLGALPSLLIVFGMIDWTPEQMGGYGTFLGVLVGAISVVLGHETEKVVTPVEDPKNDDLVSLVPLANPGPMIENYPPDNYPRNEG